jgi:hypothetical protein
MFTPMAADPPKARARMPTTMLRVLTTDLHNEGTKKPGLLLR